MNRRILIAFALGLSISPAGFSRSVMSDGADDARVEAVRSEIEIATRRMANNDVAGAARIFDKTIDSPGFESLDSNVRYGALLRSGSASIDLNLNAKAHKLLVRASEFGQADGIAWHLRLSAAFSQQDYIDSARCIVVIARTWPETLGQIRARAIISIVRDLMRSDNERDEYIALLASLFDANWTFEGREANALWLSYTEFLVKRGNLARAVEVATRIDSPETVLSLRVDKRFDGIVLARKDVFDLARTMRVDREHLDALRQRFPDRLLWVSERMSTYLMEGKPERALALADEVIAQVSKQGTKAYSDVNESYPWVLNSRSIALARLGRWDESVRQMRKAARLPESGQLNVSQTLNLGRLLAELERPDDAEDAVEALRGMSDYGLMQLALNALIGAVVREDEAAVERHLQHLREHREDDIATYQKALVQANRMDEAASVLIERLERADWRSEALAEVQQYPDVVKTPRGELHASRWADVVARNDVRTTIEKVGRIEYVPFVRAPL